MISVNTVHISTCTVTLSSTGDSQADKAADKKKVPTEKPTRGKANRPAHVDRTSPVYTQQRSSNTQRAQFEQLKRNAGSSDCSAVSAEAAARASQFCTSRTPHTVFHREPTLTSGQQYHVQSDQLKSETRSTPREQRMRARANSSTPRGRISTARLSGASLSAKSDTNSRILSSRRYMLSEIIGGGAAVRDRKTNVHQYETMTNNAATLANAFKAVEVPGKGSRGKNTQNNSDDTRSSDISGSDSAKDTSRRKAQAHIRSCAQLELSMPITAIREITAKEVN
ncbi:unnamed protein product [Gongylonema pulchrum]|uniref:Uncharacterized protein n=1 Tax=Gongylonema pulchrum TaxID=637853 RepID=A0A183EQ60_9BILA|nr:unnamed protein product [Gongylonema pulchrum]